MSLRMCVLGSGSAGNSTLVELDGRTILIDAGFGPRSLPQRLRQVGGDIRDIHCLLLTHLDQDHFHPNLLKTLLENKIPVVCHRRHEARLYRNLATRPTGHGSLLRKAGLLQMFEKNRFTLPMREGDPVRVEAMHLAHDRSGTFGYLIHNSTRRLGYATDLGYVPHELVEQFADVDLLAIESNYDPDLQAASDRPYFLKSRITGGQGHLSNQECFDAIRTIASLSSALPQHIVLLHLSRQCNCPDRLRALYDESPHLRDRLCLTSQTDPTPWLACG